MGLSCGPRTRLGIVIINGTIVGKGEANALMEHTVEGAGTRKICLIATDIAVKLYQNLGFASPNKIKIAQHQGVIVDSTSVPTHKVFFQRRFDSKRHFF